MDLGRISVALSFSFAATSAGCFGPLSSCDLQPGLVIFWGDGASEGVVITASEPCSPPDRSNPVGVLSTQIPYGAACTFTARWPDGVTVSRMVGDGENFGRCSAIDVSFTRPVGDAGAGDAEP
jgi:hypothetical protein